MWLMDGTSRLEKSAGLWQLIDGRRRKCILPYHRCCISYTAEQSASVLRH